MTPTRLTQLLTEVHSLIHSLIIGSGATYHDTIIKGGDQSLKELVQYLLPIPIRQPSPNTKHAVTVNVVTYILSCRLLAFGQLLLNDMLVLSIPEGERRLEITPCGIDTALRIIIGRTFEPRQGHCKFCIITTAQGY